MQSQPLGISEASRGNNWELGAALKVLRGTARELSALRGRGANDELLALARERHGAARRLLERIQRALGNDAGAACDGRVG